MSSKPVFQDYYEAYACKNATRQRSLFAAIERKVSAARLERKRKSWTLSRSTTRPVARDYVQERKFANLKRMAAELDASPAVRRELAEYEYKQMLKQTDERTKQLQNAYAQRNAQSQNILAQQALNYRY